MVQENVRTPFDNYIELKLAEKDFMSIRKCKELLEQQYGNYMELPQKKNKFLTTLCVIFKFKRNKT